MESVYLVRYGLMRHVGAFAADSCAFGRGDVVVVRSSRGTELGEVLAPASTSVVAQVSTSMILRLASPDDLERARHAQQDRDARFRACERVFRDGVWPFELLDVEPLLEEGRTVLYYLGPHHLESEGLTGALREICGLDVRLEPIGRDEPEETVESGCGSCGSGGGCSSEGGGGCATDADRHGGGCSTCAVKDLVGRRRLVPAN